ncbi:hypothetical protein AVEN_209023-1 [Araneus ventricosus]|uniref:Uncharacterized protein n=1 Tax=Araneus ventricosus TaxID=182803 RepID=A0A4Y2ALU2_ARAVE|nr:hypothetical protein AVEN_242558-1 [Araneus ventricosus]GBL80822.1 hypothetical protein AVEN_72706-1 [Araneus ventricosus]GBL80869.1 hypothetical protein AVEN_151529-1 [Araneus ventricosus]GBL80891.1 hypothetical protein AVEN_209023-1 [Araneus ventricosus]
MPLSSRTEESIPSKSIRKKIEQSNNPIAKTLHITQNLITLESEQPIRSGHRAIPSLTSLAKANEIKSPFHTPLWKDNSHGGGGIYYDAPQSR